MLKIKLFAWFAGGGGGGGGGIRDEIQRFYYNNWNYPYHFIVFTFSTNNMFQRFGRVRLG